MATSFSFHDRSVLVAGGTSGIGAAMTVAFGRIGAEVMVTGRNVDRGHEVRQKIPAAVVAPGLWMGMSDGHG